MNAKKRITQPFLLVILFLSLFLIVPVQPAASAPIEAPTAGDLMAAVQALRAKQGLPPLIVDAALMVSAQKHSEYQAAIGTYSHIGAGGTRAKDRAIAAGFGGGATVWISENVAMANTSTGLDVVLYNYWGDPDHWNTMTNPRYIYGGAGVAEKNGVIYYTLNTGYTTGGINNTVQATPKTTLAAPSTPLPTMPRVVPVVTSTTQPDGAVIHVVQDGQTLIGIAQWYKIPLLDLKKANKLVSDIIFTGQKLVITPSAVPSLTPTITQTPRPTQTATATPLPSRTPTLTATSTQTLTPTTVPLLPALPTFDRQMVGIAVVVVCGLGLVLVVLGQVRKKKE